MKVGKLAGAGGWSAVLLGVSANIDELAIGFTLGLLPLPALPVIVLIGVQAFVASQARRPRRRAVDRDACLGLIDHGGIATMLRVTMS